MEFFILFLLHLTKVIRTGIIILMLLPVWATGQALPSYEADPLWKAEVIDNNICQAEGCNNDTGIVSFFYEKDTLVEGVTYLKAGFGDEMQKGRGHFQGGYFRMESEKVYVRQSFNDDEFLMYDLSLEVGDEVEVAFTKGYIEWPEVKYRLVPVAVKVSNVSLIEIDGEMRKKIDLETPIGNSFPGFPFSGNLKYPYTFSWIEGVGSSFGPFYSLHHFGAYSYFLNCMNGEIMRPIEHCNSTYTDRIPNGLKEENEEQTIIITNDIISLPHGSILKGAPFLVVEMKGSIIHEGKFPESGINISALNKGLYIFSILSQGNYQSKKFIKR